LQLINPSTSPNELNTTLTPHSIIHGDACFAYFNKIWGIPCFCSLSHRLMSICPTRRAGDQISVVIELVDLDQGTFTEGHELDRKWQDGSHPHGCLRCNLS
jgi:hypothetical protein